MTLRSLAPINKYHLFSKSRGRFLAKDTISRRKLDEITMQSTSHRLSSAILDLIDRGAAGDAKCRQPYNAIR